MTRGVPGKSVVRLALLNTVTNDLEERLTNEVTVYAKNCRIRVAETKDDWSCRRFSRFLVVIFDRGSIRTGPLDSPALSATAAAFDGLFTGLLHACLFLAWFL